MSEPTYLISLTETERIAIARVLGGLVTKLVNAPLQVPATAEAPTDGTQAARAVLSPAAQTPAVAAPAPIEQRDRWARDRKGNELPNPEGCASRDVKLWKVEQKKPRGKPDAADLLKVSWQSHDGAYVDANCFDAKLFPWIIAASKTVDKKITLHLVRNGKYLNVAGVRA
jgi:hypothetical protein